MREIGNSNFDGDAAAEADAAAARSGTARFVSAQNEYNLLDARASRSTCCPRSRELGLGFLPFFPLANGLFTGKFTRTERPGRHAHLAPAPARRRRRAVGRDRGIRGVLRRARHLDAGGDVRLVARRGPGCRA